MDHSGETPIDRPPPLHLDDWLVVVEKPAGLLSVPGRGPDKQDCVAARVRRVAPDALVVHRLDMATSGLLLFARGLSMQRALSRLFETRQVAKRYVAVVAGQLQAPQGEDGWGTIALPLATDWPNRPRQVVDPEHGRASCTRWRVLDRDVAGDTTRVELEPVTGRSHQLRVHLQAIGHPILGDALYAPEADRVRAPRLLLHATGLRLVHPGTGAPVAWRSPPPF
jgi:tRNA pseudouridine32 synthase / 23S rRNA pseudouridine746 synthase